MTHNDIKRTPKTTCTDPNKVDNAGRTKLFSSTSSGRLDKVKELIKRGANVNHRDNAGWCPLHEAAVKGQYEIMRYLISSGASVNVRGCEEDTPLHDACKSRFPDCVRLLVESGADVFALNLKRQKPIDVCDDEDCIEMVQARMKQLDDLASKDEQGRTCLHRACLEGDQEEALRLLRQGADANARDHAMWSPLHCAVERQHVALVRLLVQHGADVNGCKQDGAGALHIACQKQHETIVTYLVESGADRRLRSIITEQQQ
ncbi:ankyrin [Backusella circina FSU 941]|nr:ankyrin [Backusella circina FSU 941]